VRPTLIVNPITDHDFVSAAERLVDDGAATVEALEAGLRVRYPRAVVRERELSGEQVSVWYVYRDGRWTNARAAEQRQG
jgi:hypothetical protein